MRVHHIVNSYSNKAGGAEKLVRTLHLGMIEQGVESRILGIQIQSDHTERDACSLQLSSPYKPSAIKGLHSYIKRFVRHGDIVHVHLFPASLYVSLLKQLGQIDAPIVMTEHSTSNSRRKSATGRIIDKIMYRGYERIFAISSGVKIALAQWQPKVADRIRVVQNGVHLPFTERIFRSDEKPVIVLSVGNLREPKNYENLIRSIALLNDCSVEYWIAGAGDDETMLRHLSLSLGIESKVRFLGHISNLQPIWEKADIFLMASKWEGFGMAAVEAMNASLPLVVSDIPGLREVVSSRRSCALFVDPASPRSISEALQTLISSYKLRETLGKNAFHHAAAYGHQEMVESYIREYRTLL